MGRRVDLLSDNQQCRVNKTHTTAERESGGVGVFFYIASGFLVLSFPFSWLWQDLPCHVTSSTDRPLHLRSSNQRIVHAR